MDALLTPAEVAERVRRPVATVRFWRATGTGPRSANVGGRVLYKAADVDAWIEQEFAKTPLAIVPDDPRSDGAGSRRRPAHI